MGNDVLQICVAVALVALPLWLLARRRSATHRSRGVIMLTEGEFAQPVRADAYYQDTLAKIANVRAVGGQRFETEAMLECEPRETHDRTAVRVTIDGGTVGYLPGDDADAFCIWAKRSGKPGLRCAARIAARASEGLHTGHYEVTLDIRIS